MCSYPCNRGEHRKPEMSRAKKLRKLRGWSERVQNVEKVSCEQIVIGCRKPWHRLEAVEFLEGRGDGFAGGTQEEEADTSRSR